MIFPWGCMHYTTCNPLGDDLIFSNYHNLQTTNYANTSISNSNDNTVFIDLGCCNTLKLICHKGQTGVMLKTIELKKTCFQNLFF